MALIETKYGRTVLKKAESMMAVPYVYDSTLNDYVLGEDVYDISAVIGDSIVIEQSDGSTTTKENEFVGSPLLEAVSGSKYEFTAQCIDLQDSVLKSMFGAMTVEGVNGAVAFNDDFVKIYALIRVRFKEESLPDVILPKVQMNSKLFVNQLSSRMSQGNIAGTALPKKVAIEDSEDAEQLLQFSVPFDGTETYTPFTPLLFVPKQNTPIFFYRNDGTNDIYSVIDFETGSVTHNIVVVSENNGTVDPNASIITPYDPNPQT